MPKGFIPAHGGYQDLLSYQRSGMVYDSTMPYLCELLCLFVAKQLIPTSRLKAELRTFTLSFISHENSRTTL